MTNIETKRLSKKRVTSSEPSRHVERSAQTRNKLLGSAEKIFARDGFEAAKLEEIAADAGYTRGAFYASFKSKEDLFIELMAEEVERRMIRAREGTGERAKRAMSRQELYRAARENYIRSLKNRTWNILFIEYKLFVLRHPEQKIRVSEMQTKAFEIMTSTLEEIFAGLKIKPPVSALAAGTGLAALANTIGLDLAIGKALSEEEADKMLALFFEALSSNGA
jgi:AcrR family transcriptional regulator